MEVTFWGVRGSVASPGPEFNRYGGNTACVSVRTRQGGLVILDAGTGLIVLGRTLMGDGFGSGQAEAHLLISHTHWDHIQGFPFFAPAYIPGNRLVVYGPSASPSALQGVLEGQMYPHYSPLHSLSNLASRINFEAFQGGEQRVIDGLIVRGELNPHGRNQTLCYRLQEGDRSLVYATDVSYAEGRPEAAVCTLFEGADCLIHDCTFTPEDQLDRSHRGYSSIADAARTAAACRVGMLVMFHYDQDYTDDQVDDLARRCRQLLDNEPGGKSVQLVAAREGLTLTV